MEGYPENWKHCTIHLDPETGEIHSDGDHSVRKWIEEKIKTNKASQLEPLVMQKIAGGKIDAKITISRATTNVKEDYINFDIAIGKQHILGEMELKDYANTISGLARQPIFLEFR